MPAACISRLARWVIALARYGAFILWSSSASNVMFI
jgi:hypothetical protein